MDWSTIVIALIGAASGGGIWGVVQAKINKKKSPYDMLSEILVEQRKFYAEKNEELKAEKEDSAEKSFVIAQSRLCRAKVENPNIVCPVESANDVRLKSKCNGCEHKEDCEK